MQLIRNYIITLVVFLIIDMVWLSVIARPIYKKYLGYIMAEKVNLFAAFLFYTIFILGIVVFVLNPAFMKGNWSSALLMGAFFGLVTYSTYDLTNLATVKEWPIFITVVDLLWGSFVSGITSLISYLIIKSM
ncbi:DUF2177 family protein [Mobilitalea sibirica]|uniref:DUF2177 family protein n=1 Tax=Mobilitalea sibirica TaxID=1462919 RepID=A0A8J7L1Y6_9FIRM|nr:DUF2177 family protein [Mobilitalea sibirica]MBH1939593.1 DUF2177 family protein [Mobilitalea sibirica]